MATILAISSQTVFGPVGLSAVVPALQSQGHEILALPTITLSHHPGHGKPVVQRMSPPLLAEMIDGLSEVGALGHIDAVLTGYFADVDQVGVVGTAVSRLKPRHILVDPVMGDHGALYVSTAVAAAIRDLLVPLATIITPNLFELHWLSQTSRVEDAVRTLGAAETLVTSVPEGPDGLATRLFAAGGTHTHTTQRRLHVPHGTGDALAGLYLAHRMSQEPAIAFGKAMADLDRVIAASVGSASLKVATLTACR